MKARIHVTLKTGVLDPQGEAISRALESLGFTGVESVRQGKVIDVELADGAEGQLEEMCEKLLANTRDRELRDHDRLSQNHGCARPIRARLHTIFAPKRKMGQTFGRNAPWADARRSYGPALKPPLGPS